MPIKSGIIDVVISNCVINLIQRKEKVFSEIFRILKPGGFFSISDVVLGSNLPSKLIKCVDLYAGCVAGAILKQEYIKIIHNAGFDVEVKREKEVLIPEDVLQKYLTKEEIIDYMTKCKIYSITIVGKKREKIKDENKTNNPPKQNGGCCGPKTCC